MRAARELVRAGRRPTVAEVAETAMVHRATAYRYFPSPEALMMEVAFEAIHPSPDEVLADVPSDDVAARWDAVCRAVYTLVTREERLFRTAVKATQDRWLEAASQGERHAVVRQGRRLELIDAAIEPLQRRLARPRYERLRLGLCLILGIEAYAVLKDVAGASNRRALDVMLWAGRALIREADAD